MVHVASRSGCDSGLCLCSSLLCGALQLREPMLLLPHTESASLAVGLACVALLCALLGFCGALWFVVWVLPHNSSFSSARELCVCGAALICQKTNFACSLQIKTLEAAVAHFWGDAASRRDAAAVAEKRVAAGTEALEREVAAQIKTSKHQVRF